MGRALRAVFGTEGRSKGRVFVSQKPGYRISVDDAEGGAKFREHIYVLVKDNPNYRVYARRLSDETNPRFKEVRSLEEAQEQLLKWGVKRPEVVDALKKKAEAEAELKKYGY